MNDYNVLKGFIMPKSLEDYSACYLGYETVTEDDVEAARTEGHQDGVEIGKGQLASQIEIILLDNKLTLADAKVAGTEEDKQAALDAVLRLIYTIL